MCLNLSGNNTHVEIQAGNSSEKFINYKIVDSGPTVKRYFSFCIHSLHGQKTSTKVKRYTI